jgi:tetratricopeptide (TPR) repeat protein
MQLFQLRFRHLLPLISLVLLMGGCSTQKDSVVNRTYHTTSTRFNYYFNGEESFREGIKSLESKHIDDFNGLLKVFPIGTEADATSVLSQMDRAVQKVGMAVFKHGMVIGGKEKNDWIDESYLLMGKAQLMKRDYVAARTTFEFVISRYGKQPASYEASLWKARMHIMKGEFNEAAPLLGIVGTAIDKKLTWGSTKRLYPQVYADLLLSQNNLEAAIPYLELGIKTNISKKVRIRLSYILAQTYQELGRFEEARKTYSKVLKLNPSYSFTFNARISMARCFESGRSGDQKAMVKLLNKMARDEKNLEYLDQIYFALADINLKSADTVTAIDNLRKSVSASVQNRNQKALSSLQLADLYFEIPDYVNAAAYYDSTMQFLAKEFPNYNAIKRKTDILTDLVGNLLIVQTEDSLQKVAAMPEQQRNQIIDGFIQKILAEETQKRAEEAERQQSIQFFEQESRNMQSVTQTGGFYFYSPQALSMGYSEFQKRWGKRKNEDLWRISNKQGGGFGSLAGGDQDSVAVDSVQVPKGNPKERTYYLADLPLTPEKVKASNARIAQALLNAGGIYRSSLGEPDMAIESFQKLEARFPASPLVVQAWYQLYHLYQELEFFELAQRYKQKITETYPNSDYARLLNDPDYYARLEAEKNEGEVFYQTTYEAFSTGKYDVVKRNKAVAFAKYHDKDLLGRFEYLNVLAMVKGQSVDTVKAALNRFLIEYDSTRAGEHARGILNYYDEKDRPAGKSTDTTQVQAYVQGIYEYAEKGAHIFVLVLDGNSININEAKILVADHNQLNHSLKQLSISSILLDQDRHIITVSSFATAADVMDYARIIGTDKKISDILSKGKGEMFAISSANYTKFYKRKNLAEYLSFYKHFYQKP